MAKAANLGVETLRFYEMKGLLDSPERNEVNHRVYPASALDRLRFIQRCRDAGFSLQEIREFIDLRTSDSTTCSDICNFVDGKIVRIDEQIESLKAVRRVLEKLTSQCRLMGAAPLSSCQILKHLESQE